MVQVVNIIYIWEMLQVYLQLVITKTNYIPMFNNITLTAKRGNIIKIYLLLRNTYVPTNYVVQFA